ncbi:MAG: hypothetical protein A2V66_09600 [Ignavibacteria bacterium RBG_13_36_8]|nr:MAG: hypothetical protein A2V66_09600 [Ignavibacteria bacterium RBG_13_36_8]
MPPKFLVRLAKVGAIPEETISVLKLFSTHNDWKKTNNQLLVENPLMKNSKDQIIAVYNAVKKRYSIRVSEYPPLLELVRIMSKDLPYSIKKQMLLPYFLRSEPLVEHFLLTKILPRIHSNHLPEIQPDEVISWIREESVAHKELTFWAESVVKKWNVAFHTFLRKFDYLSESPKTSLSLPVLRDEVFAFFFMHNFFQSKKVSEISKLTLWQYFGLSETEFHRYFYTLNARGWISSIEAGDITEISSRFTTMEEWIGSELGYR